MSHTTCLVLTLASTTGKKQLIHQRCRIQKMSEGISCSIWHQDVRSKSFKAFMLQDRISMDWTCSSNISLRCSIRLRSGEFGGQDTTFEVFVMFPKPLPEQFLQCGITLLKEATATGEYRVRVRNARTRGFPAEHCLLLSFIPESIPVYFLPIWITSD